MKSKALKSNPKKAASGPSLFEVEYLRQLGEELEAFLRSKTNGSIREVQLGFLGDGFRGTLQIKA